MSIAIRTDASLLDVDAIHAFLTRSYWAQGVSRERVAKSLESSLCFGPFDDERQIGFARVITDRVTFAYLCDVFVLEEHRGHGLYEQFGFQRVDTASGFMQIKGDSP